MKKCVALSALLLALFPSLWAQPTSREQSQPASIKAKTSGMQEMPGFFALYWDAKEGKIWLEIDKFDQEFLYATSLPAGLGSMEVQLDRNQPGRTRIAKFQRIGPRVLLVQPNYSFRAMSADPDLKEAVDEESAAPQARAIALLKLDELRKWLEARLTEEKDEDLKAHYLYGATQIGLFLKVPKGFKIPGLLTPPLGRAV